MITKPRLQPPDGPPYRQAWLFVAPHLLHPARNGADISIERYARFVSLHCDFVDLVGCNSVRRYRGAEIESERTFPNRLRPRSLAGVRTLLLRSHYLKERFNTRAVAAVVSSQLSAEEYGLVLASFISTVPLIKESGSAPRLFVWTHNDELKWFSDLSKTSPSWPGRAVAEQSMRWLKRATPAIAQRAKLLHVSELDRDGFDQIVQGHSNMVVPIGTDIDPIVSPSADSTNGEVVLTFVGSLGVRMATDALQHFRRHFEDALRKAFNSRLLIRIVGSTPTKAVVDLCVSSGWKLHADVGDSELARLIQESTFTFLPFSYSNGVKLKLVRSLGSGVPFLATNVTRPDGFETPPGCCFSDDPGTWVSTVQQWLARGDTQAVRHELRDNTAARHSWPAAVGDFMRKLERQKIPDCVPARHHS